MPDGLPLYFLTRPELSSLASNAILPAQKGLV
jgi:hypothetical protein